MSRSLNSYGTYTSKEKEYKFIQFVFLLLTYREIGFCVLVRFHERYITISCFVVFFFFCIFFHFHSFSFRRAPLIAFSLFSFFISFYDFLIICLCMWFKRLKASSIHNVIIMQFKHIPFGKVPHSKLLASHTAMSL